MTRRRSFLASAPLLAAGAAVPAAAAPAGAKVLRTSFRVAETGFDPVQVSDLYSRTICGAIFEPLVEFAFLERPVAVRPLTLAALPEASPDFRTFTLRLKPGIFFADDPAFGGKPRELVAADYVYTLKRHYDPRWKSNNLYLLENAKILGLSELRREAIAAKKPLDMDRPVEGLRVLDRHSFQVRLADPAPRFVQSLANVAFAAMAREVVEAYGENLMGHPVGTGPFRLVSWRRASQIVLERNPGYRDERYAEQAPAGDVLAEQAVRALAGRRLPLLDRIEVAIIEENQPRWLAFQNGEHDVLEEMPADFAPLIMPNHKLAPNLAKRGIRAIRYPRCDVALSYFNMEDPVVGGTTPERTALRRAIAMAVDVDKEIRLVRRSQAMPAQSVVAPGAWGYDPAFRSEMGSFDAARARALLDIHGYVDRDRDGWREQPDGAPLAIEYATQPDGQSRQLIEQWAKNMRAIGIRMTFKAAKWPENLKASSAGKLQMWGVGWSAVVPDADAFLSLGYGPNKGQANKARFDLPAYNRAYERSRLLPDGPERQAAIDDCKRLLVAYMPYKVHVHRVVADLAQPWVIGFHRNFFVNFGASWRFLDVDPARQQAAIA
jgi:ABC-type transport system substrate-binding protein